MAAEREARWEWRSFEVRREEHLRRLIKEYDLSSATLADGTIDYTCIATGTVTEATLRAIGEMLDDLLRKETA